MCTRVSNSQHCVSPSLQDKFVSKEGKSKHQLWQELCVLISKNPGKVGYKECSYFDVAIDNEYSIQLRNLPTGL